MSAQAIQPSMAVIAHDAVISLSPAKGMGRLKRLFAPAR